VMGGGQWSGGNSILVYVILFYSQLAVMSMWRSQTLKWGGGGSAPLRPLTLTTNIPRFLRGALFLNQPGLLLAWRTAVGCVDVTFFLFNSPFRDQLSQNAFDPCSPNFRIGTYVAAHGHSDRIFATFIDMVTDYLLSHYDSHKLGVSN